MWIVNYCGFYFISWTLDSGLEFEMWIMVVLTLFEDLHQPRLPYHLPAQDLLHQHLEEGHRLQGQDGTGSQLAQMLGKVTRRISSDGLEYVARMKPRNFKISL